MLIPWLVPGTTAFAETKNTWARDDPAILILLFGCLFGMDGFSHRPTKHTNDFYAVAAMGWSVVYSYTFLDAVKLAFIMILRDFLFVGVITATLFR